LHIAQHGSIGPVWTHMLKMAMEINMGQQGPHLSVLVMDTPHL